MKKFYMILGAALMMSSAMFAQHTIDEYQLSATDVEIANPGERGELSVSLTSPEALANANFRVYLPEGITIPKEYDEDLEEDVYVVSASTDLLKKGHTKQVFVTDDGAMGISIYNVNGGTFKAASGELIRITLEAASDVKVGEYEAKITDIDMDNEAANLMQSNGWSSKTWADIPFTIKVGTETGINEIEAAEDWNGPVYDLNGRKINGKPAQKGVYIKNGKKVVVK